MTVDRERLARIILSGINDIEEWRLGDPALAAAKGYPRAFPGELIDDWGILFVDIVLDAGSGKLVCHEVNGPNAVGSDALTGDSTLRAANEASHAIRRMKELGYLGTDGQLGTQVVTIHAHQHWQFFRTGGEFYPRVAAFADCLADKLPGQSLACYAAGDALGDEQVSVVMGDVPAITANIAFDAEARRFTYRGRPVVFMGNPNLLSDLIRSGKFPRALRDSLDPCLRILHAWRFSGLIHDKGQQQELFANTAIRPLRHFAASSPEEAVAKTRAMLAEGPVVLKPSDTSGGVGVSVVVASMSDDDIRGVIDRLIADCRRKYGENSDAMILPIRGFEFVRSTGFALEDGEHLWDLRIAIQYEPGRVLAYPVTLRLTPEAFDPEHFHEEPRRWISNVSGRRETLLRSGMDDAVLAEVGMTDEMIEQAMQACARWTSKAIDMLSRGGGKGGGVFEDAREALDEPFYHGEKFRI
ncbi:MAG: hypothetical protein R3D89_05120 [Sphingomonadaceae bacterium]